MRRQVVTTMQRSDTLHQVCSCTGIKPIADHYALHILALIRSSFTHSVIKAPSLQSRTLKHAAAFTLKHMHAHAAIDLFFLSPPLPAYRGLETADLTSSRALEADAWICSRIPNPITRHTSSPARQSLHQKSQPLQTLKQVISLQKRSQPLSCHCIACWRERDPSGLNTFPPTHLRVSLSTVILGVSYATV